ncbi:MAG: MATE family efflux transporter [Verrucomicrobiota bacterium]
MGSWLKGKWNEEAGYQRILSIALPLILSMGSHSIMLFIDRMFLARHSQEAIAAAVPAGLMNFSILCFFLGTATYTSTFIAQYIGAQKPSRVGASLWQGLRIALIGGLIIPCFSPLAPHIFTWAGHEPAVRELEIPFFQILNFGSLFFLTNAVFSSFYSGRGQTWPVMWINLGASALNAVLDYILIFGKFGFPEMGIRGAGYATVTSAGTFTLVYAFMVLRPKWDALYHTRRAWRLDKSLFSRMLKFGTPSGAQFFIDMIGFTLFVLIIGRIGMTELASSNIAQQINLVGLLPMVGMGIAASILVGQYQGAQKSHLAERVTYSALQLTFVYCLIVSSTYVLIPEILISPFINPDISVDVAGMNEIATNILKFMAIILVFDSVAILAGGTLKGAGDTRFVMIVLSVTSIFLLVLPTYLLVEVYQQSIYMAWLCGTINLGLVGSIFFWRFKSGKWKSIRVIEQ